MASPIYVFESIAHPYASVLNALGVRDSAHFAVEGKSPEPDSRIFPSELRLQWRGIGVGSGIEIRMEKISETPASAGEGPSMSFQFGWNAATAPQLFPNMKAAVVVSATTETECRIGFLGQYVPPLGTFGELFDAAAGHQIAEASVRGFVHSVVAAIERRIESQAELNGATAAREQAEVSLLETNERFGELTNHLREVFWLATPDLQELLYVSPGYARMFGGTPPGGRRPLATGTVIHPADRERVAEFLSRPVQDESEVEFRVLLEDGSEKWIRNRGFPVRRDPASTEYRRGGIAEDITGGKRAEESLRQSASQLRALNARLENAQEIQATRISREIHDQLGSALISIKWELEWLHPRLARLDDLGKDDPLAGRVSKMIHLLSDTVQNVRRIAREIRPSPLDDLNLIETIEGDARGFQERTGIECSFENNGEPSLGRREKMVAYRILHESLTNVLRHSGAKQVRISANTLDTRFELIIRDDGVGFTRIALSDPGCLGLLGIKERAQSVGGTVFFSNAENSGAKVRLLIDLQDRGAPIDSNSAD